MSPPIAFSTISAVPEPTIAPPASPVTFEVNGANRPIAGYTTDITVLADRAITLRYYGSSWYVISNNS